MNKGDKMWAVFNPPDRIQLTATQADYRGKDIEWKAVWSDPSREGQWIMCPVGAMAMGSEEENCNTVTSAYLNQSSALEERKITEADIRELDRRIESISIMRDALVAKSEEQSESKWDVGSCEGFASLEDVGLEPIPEYGEGLKEHVLSEAEFKHPGTPEIVKFRLKNIRLAVDEALKLL